MVNVGKYTVCPMDPVGICILPMTCIGHILLRFCRLIRLVRIVKVFRIRIMRDLRLMVKGAVFGAGLSPPLSRWLEAVEGGVDQDPGSINTSYRGEPTPFMNI